VTVEKTLDYGLLWRIATHPSIYRLTSDDFSPLPGRWKVAERVDSHYLLATTANEILGFCAFYPENGVCWQAHICFLPCAYGEKTRSAFAQMLKWMWAKTRARRIWGAIPTYNTLAIKFAKEAGFGVCGRNFDSWQKDGKLYDMILLGISRPTQ